MDTQSKLTKMTTEPVGKLIAKLSVPTIISMLVTTFYNMADTFFVGQIKGNDSVRTLATGAVSVIFAFMSIMQAVGFFFGHGSGNYISRQLGKNNYDEAEKMAVNGFVCSFIGGVIIMIFGYIFTTPLAKVLGSTDSIMPYSVDYLRTILFGVPFITSSLVLNNQLRFQGNATYGMIGITTGAVINLVLDPLFIMVFDMGIKGAGLATAISQIISFCLLFLGTRKGDAVKIRLKRFSLNSKHLKEIAMGGLPSLGRQSISSLATACLNHAIRLACVGTVISAEAGIAGLGVVTKIMFFGNAVIIGCGQGFQPVCGYNYGAEKFDRVKKAFWFTVKIGLVFAVVISLIFSIFARQIIGFFSISDEAKEVATKTLQFQSVTFVFSVFVTVTNMMMQNIGKAFKATLLAVSRQGIMFIPIVFIFASTLKIKGIELSQTVADFLTFILSLPLGISVLKELDNKQKQKENLLNS